MISLFQVLQCIWPRGELGKAIEMFSTAQSLGLYLDEQAYTNMTSYRRKAGEFCLLAPLSILEVLCGSTDYLGAT